MGLKRSDTRRKILEILERRGRGVSLAELKYMLTEPLFDIQVAVSELVAEGLAEFDVTASRVLPSTTVVT